MAPRGRKMIFPETMVFRKGKGHTTKPTNLDCWVCFGGRVWFFVAIDTIFTHRYDRKKVAFNKMIIED